MRIILASLLAAALAAPALSDCRAPYWLPSTVLERSAEFVATADFDENGKADVAGNTATTIFVSRNDGNGALLAPADVYTGTIRGSVVAAELTGDAHTDLLFASGNSLIVLPGNGDGTFATPIPSVTTIAPNALSVAPFDADNDADLAAFDAALAVLVVFTNDGAGNFTERTRMNLRANARALATGDLDGDTRTDIVVGYPVTAMDAFYGRSDNAFDTATILGSGSVVSMRIGDMTGDGLRDLVTVKSPFDNVVMIRNLGSRSFGDPLLFPTAESTRDHTIGELTGDAIPDVIATGQGCAFWTLTGTGLGTLTSRRNTDIHATLHCSPDGTGDIALGDFDGDGRTDAVVSAIPDPDYNETPRVVLMRNLCGDGRITATTTSPLITTGQSATIRVNILAPTGVTSPIVATGSVSIREGETTLATGTLANGFVSIPVSGLTLGEHSLIAAYAGDAQYEPLQTTITIRVTNETTTTTITTDPTSGVYGKYVVVTATVTSSTGDTPTGPLELFVQEWNGVNVSRGNAPGLTLSGPWQVGTWTLVANFAGDATHPPSSATLSFVVGKATPKISFTKASAPSGQTTSAFAILPRVNNDGGSPTGTVTITEGNNTIGTSTLTSGYAGFTLPAMSIGRHYLRVRYDGDANHFPADLDVPFMVFPSAQQTIDARGNTNGITITWWTNQLIIRRRDANQTWAQSTTGWCCPEAPMLDTTAVPEKVYLYRMEGHDNSIGQADLGMRIGFTDDPLRAGTTIKAVHLSEIVRAANIVRTAANMTNLSLTANAGGTVITAAQVNALRNAINEARVSLGAVPYSFTNAIAAGTPIRAADIQELRESIR